MLIRPALLFIGILSTLVCAEKWISQKHYCASNNIVKALIMRNGYIQSKAIRAEESIASQANYSLPKWYRPYEIKILEVYKTNYTDVPGQLKNSLWYAHSKDVDYDADADGCKLYGANSDPLMFHFDDFENIVIKRNCADFNRFTSFEKNAMKTKKYDCECPLEECYNRMDKKIGIPKCRENKYALRKMLCKRNDAGRCIWKGSKATCVNPKGEETTEEPTEGPIGLEILGGGTQNLRKSRRKRKRY